MNATPAPSGNCLVRNESLNNAHAWGRDAIVKTVRGNGSVTVWQCNYCTAVLIYQEADASQPCKLTIVESLANARR